MPAKTFDPVSMLGCTSDEARSLLKGHFVPPGEVEAVARSHCNRRRHLHDDDSCLVVTSQAAQREVQNDPPTSIRFIREISTS